jgi:hypothetical protein
MKLYKILAFLTILVFIFNSCTTQRFLIFKDKNYIENELIGSNLILVPINHSTIQSNLISRNNEEPNHRNKLNLLFLESFSQNIFKIRLNYKFADFDLETSESFDKLWEELYKNSLEQKANQGTILNQPQLKELSNLIPKTYIEELSRGSFENPDFLLLYTIKQTIYSQPKQATILTSYVILIALLVIASGASGSTSNINSSSGSSSVVGDTIDLNFILIDKRKGIIKSYGTFSDQKDTIRNSMNSVVKKMIQFILDEEEKSK